MRAALTAGLTDAQALALLRDSDSIQFSAGLQLLDSGLNVVADLTPWLVDGTVNHAAYATVHGTASLRVSTELDWGTAILRPTLTLSAPPLSATFNMGAYLTSSPNTNVGETPRTHDVDCFDMLQWINTKVGGTYTIAGGTGYLDAVEAILLSQGLSAYHMDRTQGSQVLATPKVWALDNSTTWLNVINDLLGAVGYMGLWADWDGTLQAVPYIQPVERGPEWVYTMDPVSSTLAQDRTLVRDWFDAPNRWVFYWSQDPAGAAPVEGNGKYTYVNDSYGPTSVLARGRVITAAPEQVDAVDQTSLIAAAQQRIDADLRLSTTINVKTYPNPMHWHFDRMLVADTGVGISDVLGTKWSLPLIQPSGGDMTHEWTVLT